MEDLDAWCHVEMECIFCTHAWTAEYRCFVEQIRCPLCSETVLTPDLDSHEWNVIDQWEESYTADNEEDRYERYDPLEEDEDDDDFDYH